MKKPPFEAFTINASGIASSLVTEVLVFPPVLQTEIDKAINVPVKAIWDTGATKTCIHPRVVDTLGLTPIGQTMMQTAGKTCPTNTYLVNIILPNRLLITGAQVATLDSEAMPECLIGMDIIGMGDLAVTSFEGKTSFTFRFPSYKRLDFVREFFMIMFGGTKPYHACPCGARDKNGQPMKYKDCHQRIVDNPITSAELLPNIGNRLKLI